MPGEQVGKGGVEQDRCSAVRCRGGTSPAIGSMPRRPQAPQPLVVPATSRRRPGRSGADRLPQHRIAERRDAEGGDAIEIVDAGAVACLGDLVAVEIADAGDGAFDAAPELERGPAALSFERLHESRQRPSPRPIGVVDGLREGAFR